MSEDRQLQLQDLLSNMRSEGEVVTSAGDFTIHHSKAEAKLKKFQLSNPFFYVLKLVQSAVLSGATSVDIECQAHQVSLKHDGEPPYPAELKELLNHLFLTQEERAPRPRSLQRLASAVNTAVAAHARQLTIRCDDGNASYEQSWRASGTEFRELKQSKGPGVTFVLKRKADDVASSLRHVGDTRLIDLVKGHRSSIQKEEAALWDRCIFAPIPVRVNGERISRTCFGTPRYPDYNGKRSGKVPFRHWLENRDHYRGRLCHKRYHLIQAYHRAQDTETVHLRAFEQAHSFLISQSHPHQKDLPCAMILGLESGRNLPNRVNFLQEGVLIEQEVLDLPVQGLFALLSAHQLKTDLSGFKLSRGESYDQLLEEIKRAVGEMVAEHRKLSEQATFGVPSLSL